MKNIFICLLLNLSTAVHCRNNRFIHQKYHLIIISAIELKRTEATDRINVLSHERFSENSKKFFVRYCPEFVPIAARNEGHSESLSLGIKEALEVSASESNIDITMKLQERGQGVQFYEQGLFALCIAALNQWIETTDSTKTEGTREDCINKARENYTQNSSEHKMPDVCLTEYERALYKLREDTRDVMIIEALYQNQNADNVPKNPILQNLDDHPITKFLKQQEKDDLKQEQEKLERERGIFEHEKKIQNLKEQQAAEQLRLDKNKFNACVTEQNNKLKASAPAVICN